MQDWIGTYAIVRSSPSGVWAGKIVKVNGTCVEMTDARRLWRWWAAEGVSLSGVAAKGLHPEKLSDCRVAVPVSRVMIFDVCEILEVSPAAKASIVAIKAVTS